MIIKDPWAITKEDNEFPRIYKCGGAGLFLGNGCGANIKYWHIAWCPNNEIERPFRLGSADFSDPEYAMFGWAYSDTIDTRWVRADDILPEYVDRIKRKYHQLKAEGLI